MEISRTQFAEQLPEIFNAIETCEFLSIDTELTGINAPGLTDSQHDTLEERYAKIATSVSQFQILQFGLSTFHREGDSYVSKAFNFYLWPGGEGERYFTCQASCMDFLVRNGFDFNKWAHYG